MDRKTEEVMKRNASNPGDWLKWWDDFDYDLYLRILIAKQYHYDRPDKHTERDSKIKGKFNGRTFC